MMTPSELALWEKIEAFPMDDPQASCQFSDRLSYENGWKKSYTKRVIAEYKKFIWLGCVSETGVTPSDPIDQAWHLHLLYTKSYWIDLCRDTLHREIHHQPTKGGEDEAAKFANQYMSSRALYADKFGTEPPADIWLIKHRKIIQDRFERATDQSYKHKRVQIPRGILPSICIMFLIPLIVLVYKDYSPVYFLSILVIVIVYAVYRDRKSGPGNGERDGNDGSGSDSDFDSDSSGWNYGHHTNSGHHGHDNGGHGHSGGDHGGHSGCGGHHSCGSSCGHSH